MSRWMYLLYGLIVVVVSTMVNLSDDDDGKFRYRSGGSSGWSSWGGHK